MLSKLQMGKSEAERVWLRPPPLLLPLAGLEKQEGTRGRGQGWHSSTLLPTPFQIQHEGSSSWSPLGNPKVGVLVGTILSGPRKTLVHPHTHIPQLAAAKVRFPHPGDCSMPWQQPG